MLCLIFWCHYFLLPWGGTRIFICEDAAFVTPLLSQTCIRLTLFLTTSSNTAYSLAGIRRFDKILPCPHEDGQERRLSSASIKFLWLGQIHDPSGTSSALDSALSTIFSCCSQHFFPVRVLASFIHLLPVATLSDNDSKQIAVATSFCMSVLLTLRTFLVKVKKS